MFLSCCLGLCLYTTNRALSHMWGCLQPWRKVVTYLPGTTKLGKLRESHNSTTAPTAKPDPGFSSLLGGCRSVEPPRDARNVTAHGCTCTLDGLVGSHTRLAIYHAHAICCQRVVVHASLDTRFKGMQVVTYLANIKQLKSHWLKVPLKGLGTCIWINKSHNPFWLCSAPWEALRQSR